MDTTGMEKDIPKKIKASSSEEVNAETETEIVFVRALEYIKKKALDLLSQMNMQCQGIKDIQWVLTVPAIWSDKSKGYMMKWAIKAGMVDPSIPNHLIIAYEPECASLSVLCEMFDNGLLTFKFHFIIIYLFKKKKKNCKEVPGATEVKDEKKEKEKEKKTLLQTGDAYMMLDLGGGTADIACHEIKGPFEVKELIAPSGGAWGSYYIDKAFEFMLIEIFSSDHMNEFKAIHPGKFRELMSNFERSKCDFFKGEYNNSNSNSNSNNS
ncbi:hypothetical protein RFI_34823, partial [Reticulomyxa filosa]